MGRAYEVRKASIQKNGAAKTKIYTTYAKKLYLVGKRGGASLEGNSELKHLAAQAKREGVPADIIKRAIEKAAGIGGEDYTEVTYEGFGPGASTLIVKTLTDNVNRTVSLVREAFKKSANKQLGVTGSVTYMYDYLAIITFKGNDEEEVFNNLLEAGIEPIDIESENDEITVTLKPSDHNKAKDALEKCYPGIEYIFDEEGMFAKDKITLEGEDLEKFNLLLDFLNNIDDVTDVYHNVEL